MNAPLQTIYLRALKSALYEAAEVEEDTARYRELLKKIAFYGVRFIDIMPQSETRQETTEDFQFVMTLKRALSDMTLEDFMNVFPIKKDYDGEKTGVKDYYSTIEAIKGIDPAAKIGENINLLISEYWNLDIHRFFMAMFQISDDVSFYNKEPSLVSLWAAKTGFDTTNVVVHKGKKYLIEHGRPHLIRDQPVAHLQAVK